MLKSVKVVFMGLGPTLLYERPVRDPGLAGVEEVHPTKCRLWPIQGGIWRVGMPSRDDAHSHGSSVAS